MELKSYFFECRVLIFRINFHCLLRADFVIGSNVSIYFCFVSTFRSSLLSINSVGFRLFVTPDLNEKYDEKIIRSPSTDCECQTNLCCRRRESVGHHQRNNIESSQLAICLIPYRRDQIVCIFSNVFCFSVLKLA